MNNIGFLDDLSDYFILFSFKKKRENITGRMETKFLLAK
jgi:hypothetical protein